MSDLRFDEKELSRMATAGSQLASQALKRCRTGKTAKNKKKAVKGVAGRSVSSKLEKTFAMQCKAAGLPDMKWGKNELLFHPIRKWRFDFAWEEFKVAVEAEGGTYTHGQARADKATGKKVVQKSRHLTPTGYHEDCIKYAEAAILGWTVIRADAKMIKTGAALKLLERALEAKGFSR